MREILFRGKRKYGGGWVEGSLIKVGEKYCCILSEDDGTNHDYPYLNHELGTIDGCAIPVDPESVGQYTGMQDKNGKKVFEGDILSQTDKYDKNLSLMRVVKYEMSCGSCCTQVFGFGASGYFHLDFIRLDEPFEVIGNIHDNPGLVKE